MPKFYVGCVQRVYETGRAIIEAETAEEALRLAEGNTGDVAWEWEFLENDEDYPREVIIEDRG